MKTPPQPSSPSLYARISRSEASILALTGLTLSEFTELSAEFAKDWNEHHSQYTLQDMARQRSQATQEAGPLPTVNDKLLFICMYLKTYPRQELQAAFFDMNQPQAHFWIHRLARFLLLTLKRLAHTPERDANALASLLEGCERVYLDGTERPVQRHHDEATQKKDYSEKKKPIPKRI